MTRRIRYASFGSISSGTMLPEDLIPAFAWELKYLAKRIGGMRRHAKLIAEAESLDFSEDSDETADAAETILSALFDALEEYAPPYAYFGSHPGDGADYGFWLSENFDEDFDGLRVDDTADIPRGFSGEVLHVNDHGNPTLYACSRGRCREIWALV